MVKCVPLRTLTFLILILLWTASLSATATPLGLAVVEEDEETDLPLTDDRVDGLLDEIEGLIVDPLTKEARLLVGHRQELPEAIDPLLEAFQGRMGRTDEALSFAVVHVPEANVEAFLSTARTTPGVTWAKPDGMLELFVVPDDPLYSQQWGPPAIGMEAAWDTTTGSHNVTVSVVDTGIAYDHPDLEDNICVIGPDFGQGDDDPYDTYGHGTHVAGTVAAVIDNGEGVAGMADACLMAVKIENQGGLTWSDAASGVQWSADNGADVIQMSWGGYTDPGEPLVSAIENAHQAGVLLVAAAGNAGCNGDTVGFPAAYPQVAAVAALAPPGDERAGFSSCGPTVEISAPGQDIMSTVPETIDPSGYASFSGTSMASPHASGLAALLWSEHPEKEASEIRCILAQTALDLGGVGRDPFTGYGRIDAPGALASPLCAPAPPEAPSLQAFSGDESALLGWTTPHAWGGIDGYHIYRGSSPDDLEHLVTLGTTNDHEDTEADLGVTYHYAVAAYNEAGNGTLSDPREVTLMSALSLPHEEGWESGLGNWTADGLWSIGTHRTQSGDNSMHFGIEGSTPDDSTYETGRREVGDLLSPPIDLRGTEQASLAFWSHHNMEGHWWEHPIVQVATPDAPGRFETVWSLHFDASGAAALDLTPYTGQVILLRFHVDTIDPYVNDYEGWYLDDLNLTTDPMPQYAPTVEIVNPSDGSIQPGDNLIVASFQDANGIQDVAEGLTRTDSGDWQEAEIVGFYLYGHYSGLQTGAHTGEAQVTDRAGNHVTNTTSFNVDADPPQMTIDNPSPGASVSCRATINGTASDEGGAGLAAVVFWADDLWLGIEWFSQEDSANWSAQVNFAPLESGPFNLTGVIYDGVWNMNTTILSLERSEVDCRPKVEITAPASGTTVGCTALVEGTAQSNDDDVPLYGVSLMLDGAHVGWVQLEGDTNATWEKTISSGAFPVGEYSLVATVYDEDGNGVASKPVTIHRDDTACLPEIEVTSPTKGEQADCLLDVTAQLTSPYGAGFAVVHLLVDGRVAGWFPVEGTNTTFSETIGIHELSPGDHELVLLVFDDNYIHNESAPRTFERSGVLCVPELEVTSPQDGETVSGVLELEGSALFPEPGLGVPTEGQLEILVNWEIVHTEDVTTGNWSHEVAVWDRPDGPLQVTVVLWLDDSDLHDWQRFQLMVDNQKIRRIEESHHAGNIGCSVGLFQVDVQDACGANHTAIRQTESGLTGVQLRLSWDEGLTGAEYLSLRLQIGDRDWHDTAGPGDTELVLRVEAEPDEFFTDQLTNATMEVRAGSGQLTPAVAVDVDYELEAVWAWYGAGLPAP